MTARSSPSSSSSETHGAPVGEPHLDDLVPRHPAGHDEVAHGQAVGVGDGADAGVAQQEGRDPGAEGDEGELVTGPHSPEAPSPTATPAQIARVDGPP